MSALPLPEPRRTANAVTAYGMSLQVRPVSSADRDAVAAFFARLGDHARYQRFMGAKPALSPRELDMLVEVDHRTHEALVAIDPLDGTVVAEARYARWARAPHSADVAFVVAEDWRGQGIATMLARDLVGRAAASGFARLTATTFGDNAAARAVLRHAGFRTCSIGSGVADLVLDLR